MAKHDDLKINRAKLNDELSNQAANFAYAAEESEILKKRIDEIETLIEMKSDKVASVVRTKYKNVNVKLRPNETTIKELIRADAEIIPLHKELREVTHAYRVSKVRVDAMRMRAEMMVALANNIRQERKASETRLKV